MASFDYRLNPPYPIKECSSCGALYTTDYCCSKRSLRDKIICDLNKTPDLSQRPPPNCPKYGNPVDGQYCQGCALLRKKFKEDLFTYCIENEILQDASELSNDNTNIVNALQEPFVVKQDPGAHYGYNCPTKVPVIPNPKPCNNQTVDELPQTLPSFDPTCYSEDGKSFTYDSKSNLVDDFPNLFNPPLQPPPYSYEFCGNDVYYGHDCPLQRLHNDVQNIHEELAVYINTPSWDRPTIYYNNDDDKDCTIAVTPKEPDNSLSIWDEHLDTFSVTESDEFIKSSVENLVPNPNTPVCYLCTCEQCGNILNYGTCLNCNLGTGNSFTYDPIPESFNEVQISPNQPPQCHFNIYLCQICESNSHYGYECSQRVPLVCVNPLIDHHCCYECGNSLNDFFCYQCTCEFCGNGAHVGYNCPAQVPSFQTLPSFPQQYPCCEDCGVTHEPYQCQPKNHDYYHEQNSCYDSNSFGFDHGQPPRYTREEKRIEEEQAAKAQNWKLPVCYDDDDDEERPNSLQDNIISGLPPVENLVLNPSESEGENGCDVPSCFTTFSNILFDAEYEFNSVDDQSCFDEDVPEKIFSNPLFEEEIIFIKIDSHHFNAESDLIESMLNHDSSIISSSSKIDSLLDEFAGELTLLKLILPGIDETDCHPENEIHFAERLLYDNSSPRPPEEFVSENSNADIESFSPSPIPTEDSDSFMEEIDLTFNPDNPMPPSIEEDDDDSERDILIHEELLDNCSLSLHVNESFRFDISSFSCPPAKPPDGNTRNLLISYLIEASKFFSFLLNAR
nr:hypothetical protein [Tanacetum cinerariifolium]